MRKLRRSECSVLPLVLKSKWFDMIALGQKKEEYREYSEYWRTRIWNWEKRACLERRRMVIELRRGYAALAPRTAFLSEGYGVRDKHSFPRPDWGEPQTEHFVLPLGERVELEGER